MRRAAALILAILPIVGGAQTVYRCETAGKVAYSDAPCIGAKVIDATPTKGMDKSSGRSSKGKEVQREEFRALVDQGIRPLTGASHEQMNVLRKRQPLSPEHKLTCTTLDTRLPRLEFVAHAARPSEKAQADLELYKARKLFFDLKC